MGSPAGFQAGMLRFVAGALDAKRVSQNASNFTHMLITLMSARCLYFTEHSLSVAMIEILTIS